MAKTEFASELRRLTEKHGPKLGLKPNEVVGAVMVWPSKADMRRFQEGIPEELLALKELKAVQETGQVVAELNAGNIPLTREQIQRLSPRRGVGIRILWSLSTGEDTATINEELDGGTRRGIRTRVLTDTEKQSVGILDDVVTVTTLRLRPDSPILRKVKPAS